MSFRTFKPLQLSLLFRTIERSGSIYGSFSLLTMTVRNGIPALLTEPSLWKALAKYAPEFIEAGVVKSQPEFVVFGHAYAYDGAAEGAVGAKFAGVKKWGRVFGPRQYPNDMQAAPFEKIRLDWHHSYGGADFAANPSGVGRAKDDKGNIALPYFEPPQVPWRPNNPDQEPFGFGPLDVMHPQRQKLVGTYDDEWLKIDFPGMPRNADWRFFQIAPPDQRFDAELRGDEPFDLAGLHPTERVLQGCLPGIKPRLFVERGQDRGLKEVECRLRTVVFLPDADAVVQIWQGLTKVGDEDASELTHLLAGLEALDATKPDSHYVSTFARRLAEQDGILAMLRDEDLLPEGISFESLVPGDIDLNRPPAADSLQGRLEKKNLKEIVAARAEVASHGLDPDLHAPPLPGPREVIPPPHQLGDYLRELDARAQNQILAGEASKRKLLDETAAEFATRGESFDHILEEIAISPIGPPKPRTPDLLDDLRKTKVETDGNNIQVHEIAEMLGDARLQEQWHAADHSVQKVYEQSAHLQNPAPRALGRYAKRQQRWVADHLAARQPLKGFDLTGADLREFDLRGANLDGAMLEAVCLDGVDLSGASAKGTVFSHASFINARADDCDFSAANLGKANFTSSSACRAVFTRAILWEADFTQALLRGARFVDAESMHVKLAGADLSEAVLDDLLLYQTDLSQTRLSGASINGTQFLENKMIATNFAGARGHGAVFLKMHGENLCFDGADLTGAMFVQEPKLPRASMRDTVLTKVFAYGVDLTGADLSRANLDACEFGHSTLQGANLRGVRARGAGLRFADLSQAEVAGADLRGALLGNAKLHGARFDASSLFMADLARIQIDTHTSFDNANFGRARIYPRWEPPKS
jgi:uncharacterized protein YjbI with pentapeptide repeats